MIPQPRWGNKLLLCDQPGGFSLQSSDSVASYRVTTHTVTNTEAIAFSSGKFKGYESTQKTNMHMQQTLNFDQI